MTEAQWMAIQNHDDSYDGQFWYGSINTHTFCRPSCKSRTPERCNILLYSSIEEAKADGKTPCRRCRPDQLDWAGSKKELAQAAAKIIQREYTEKFSLPGIASRLYVNKSYLLRVFRQETGHTLLWYHNHIRCEKAKTLMQDSSLTLTEIAEQIGFTSSAHFSRVFTQMCGISPMLWRKKASQ
ncbi:MAG: methylphosphotriester-DNA--protein-cysteine methyltransferase family protein [Clostridia bacterium]|nr:methylphosphotriester-DNA--protein-cysteine methyltransferase family protein [Clostridia bacterium]